MSQLKNKILIIEDDPGICKFLRVSLQGNDYDVIETNTGAKALEIISSHCPDLILLDLGDGNNNSKRVQEKLGFTYHHTCQEVDVPLMNEIRVGHTNFLTKEKWKAFISKDR